MYDLIEPLMTLILLIYADSFFISVEKSTYISEISVIGG
jgi:hypothetical protein